MKEEKKDNFFDYNWEDRKIFHYNKIKIYNKFYIPFRISLSDVIFGKIKKPKKQIYIFNKKYLYNSLGIKSYLNNNLANNKFDYFNYFSNFSKYKKLYNFYLYYKLKKKKIDYKLPFLLIRALKSKIYFKLAKFIDFSEYVMLNVKYFLRCDLYNYYLLYYNMKYFLIFNIINSIKKYFLIFNKIHIYYNKIYYNKIYYNKNFNFNKLKFLFKYKNFNLMQGINKILIKKKKWNSNYYYKWYLEHLKKFASSALHINYLINKITKCKFNRKFSYNHSLYKLQIEDFQYIKIYNAKLIMSNYITKFYYIKNFVLQKNNKFSFYISKKFFFIYNFLIRILIYFFYNFKFFILNLKKKFKAFMLCLSLLNINLLYKYYKQWLIIKSGKKIYYNNVNVYLDKLKDKYINYKKKINIIRKRNRRYLNYFKRRAIKNYKFRLRRIRYKIKNLKFLCLHSFSHYLKKDKKHVLANYNKLRSSQKNKYRFNLPFVYFKRSLNRAILKKTKIDVWYKGYSEDRVKELTKRKFYMKNFLAAKVFKEVLKNMRIKK